MQKYYELQVVLEYIESHLKEDISADEVAKACLLYTSDYISGLRKGRIHTKLCS